MQEMDLWSSGKCDCGTDNCITVGDKCCDGTTCGLYAFASCSNKDECCEDCIYKTAGSYAEPECPNSCDLSAEYCTGTSSECPPDYKAIEGTKCTNSLEDDTNIGYCYQGECQTIKDQCNAVNYDLATDAQCGYTPYWQVGSSDCASWGGLMCLDGSDICRAVDRPEAGTPCNVSQTSVPYQCVGYECTRSELIYTHVWTVGSWEECNKTCRDEGDVEPGYQTRIVECTLLDGSVLSDSECTGDKPIEGRICNDFVCKFCANEQDQADGFDIICGYHGDCDEERQLCDCDAGWDGSFCGNAPALNFTGIVSHDYIKAPSGETIVERANPCWGQSESIVAEYDADNKVRTVPIDGVTTLSQLYIGSGVGVRYESGLMIY